MMVGGTSSRDKWVAADGSDDNPGTVRKPWASIDRVNAEALRPGAVVYFKGNDLFFGQLIARSGEPGRPIRYRSYGGGAAVLSGGAAVATWTLVDAGKKIWRASFSASTGRPRAVWVDNRRCVRARTTSLGTMTPTSTGWDSTLLASAAFPQEVELQMPFAAWSQKYVQVQSATATTITISPTVKGIMNSASLFLDYGGSDVPAAAENIYEVFVANAAAQTFFQDRTNNFLYLIPPTDVSDPNGSSVIAGVNENVVTLSGVHDVIVEDLEIGHTNNLRAFSANAYIANQGGASCGTDFSTPNGQSKGTLTPFSSAVLIDTCERVKLDRTIIARTSNHAVTVRGATSEWELAGIICKDTGGADLQIGNPGFLYDKDQPSPPPQDPQPTAGSVHDCVFSRAGVDFRDLPNVIGWYFDTTTISHCLIQGSPWCPVSIGWGFGFFQPGFTAGIVVEYCEISDGMALRNDGGGIYFNGYNTAPSVGRFNWVHDIGNSSSTAARGLYLDGGSHGWTYTGNVVNSIHNQTYQINSNDNGSLYNTPRSTPNNVVTGNTDDSATYLLDNANNTTSPNTTVSTAAAQAAGAALGTGPRAPYAGVVALAASLVI